VIRKRGELKVGLDEDSQNNYDVQGLVKPGAGAGILINSANSEIASLTKKNVVILCGGANDVSKNNSKMALRHIRNFIETNSHTNTILGMT